MKRLVSLEFAEDRGLVSEVDGYVRSGFVVRECSEEEYRRRLAKRNKTIGVDSNGMVEVDF